MQIDTHIGKRDRDTIQMACGFCPLLQVTANLRYREQSGAGMSYEFLLGNVVRCFRLLWNFGRQMHARPSKTKLKCGWVALSVEVRCYRFILVCVMCALLMSLKSSSTILHLISSITLETAAVNESSSSLRRQSLTRKIFASDSSLQDSHATRS